jgi:LAO/AO transport system kinase
VVVTIPGLGDGIQALKAGVFEVADVIVVNKADRPGVDATVRDLATMLELREAGTDAGETVRQPIEIVRTVAARGEGTATLVAAIEAHRLRQQAGGRFADRRRDHARARVAGILSERWRRRTRAILDADSAGQVAAGLVDDVAARRLDPYSAADRLDGPGVGAVSRT